MRPVTRYYTRTLTLSVAEDMTLLHNHSVRPGDHDKMIKAGFELVKVESKGPQFKFKYQRPAARRPNRGPTRPICFKMPPGYKSGDKVGGRFVPYCCRIKGHKGNCSGIIARDAAIALGVVWRHCASRLTWSEHSILTPKSDKPC